MSRKGSLSLLAGVALVGLLAGCGGGSGGTTTSTGGASSPAATQPTPPPPGLPSDWQSLAVSAANAALQTCAQSDSLSPTGCPQTVGGLSGLAVHWTLLNGPLAHAVAVPGSGGISGAAGQVSVYGRYQMSVSYTEPGQRIRPNLDYSGGIAYATMSWDGTSFQNVQFLHDFGAGTFSGLPLGVTVAPFTRPPGVTDAAAIAAVQAGFHDCGTIPVPPTRPSSIPNCPMTVGSDDHATSGHWTINGDPMQGALVSFDTEHGYIAVTGSYDMSFDYVTPPEGFEQKTSWSSSDRANYTATLAWDGKNLQLLKIS